MKQTTKTRYNKDWCPKRVKLRDKYVKGYVNQTILEFLSFRAPCKKKRWEHFGLMPGVYNVQYKRNGIMKNGILWIILLFNIIKGKGKLRKITNIFVNYTPLFYIPPE